MKAINGQVGRPQTQGAVERCNRSIKDRVRGLLLDAQLRGVDTVRCVFVPWPPASCPSAAHPPPPPLLHADEQQLSQLWPTPLQLGLRGDACAEDDQQRARLSNRRPPPHKGDVWPCTSQHDHPQCTVLVCPLGVQEVWLRQRGMWGNVDGRVGVGRGDIVLHIMRERQPLNGVLAVMLSCITALLMQPLSGLLPSW